MTGNKICLGRKLSKEHLAAIAKANIGSKRSEETKRQMSESMKGKNKGKPSWNKGLKFKNIA